MEDFDRIVKDNPAESREWIAQLSLYKTVILKKKLDEDIEEAEKQIAKYALVLDKQKIDERKNIEKKLELELENEMDQQVRRRKTEEHLLDMMFTSVHECYCISGRDGYEQDKSKTWLLNLISNFNIEKMNRPPPKGASDPELWMRATYNRVREGWKMDFDERTKWWLYNLVEDYDIKKKCVDRPIDGTAENGTWLMVEKEW